MEVDQLEIFRKLVLELVYPEPGSKRYRYLDGTFKMLKDKAKQKAKGAKLNEIFINEELYFIPTYI